VLFTEISPITIQTSPTTSRFTAITPANISQQKVKPPKTERVGKLIKQSN